MSFVLVTRHGTEYRAYLADMQPGLRTVGQHLVDSHQADEFQVLEVDHLIASLSIPTLPCFVLVVRALEFNQLPQTRAFAVTDEAAGRALIRAWETAGQAFNGICVPAEPVPQFD